MITFSGTASPTACSFPNPPLTPCACLPPASRTAVIEFGKPFDDISGDLQLLLTCDNCFKLGKVTSARVEAYLQFVSEGKPCPCCIEKLDNNVTIELIRK